MRALWHGQLIAESDNTIVIEGSRYFPPESVRTKFLKKSGTRSLCYWKGLASYYDVVGNGYAEKNAAWYYPKPTRLSKAIMRKDFSNYIAFWKNVKVVE